MVSKVECADKYIHLALIQYLVKTNDVGQIFKTSHGIDKKKSEPYIRTKPSVLDHSRRIGKKGNTKNIINQIESMAGDIMCISSPSDLPRHRQQIYNVLRKVEGRVKSRSTGPAKTPDITTLMSLQQSGTLLKDISLAYGMGGECAIESAFEEVFPIEDTSKANLHLCCFYFVKDDIARKLTSLSAGKAEKKKVIDEILGRESNGRRFKGLVDCE